MPMGIENKQHQGEPVALPERKGTHLHYDTLMPTFSKGWNACLDEIAKLGPLYTHAAPGEVERLRAELEVTKKLYAEACQASYDFGAMQTKLAERDALLREVVGSAAWGISELRGRIEKFLSASAEPGAPKES